MGDVDAVLRLVSRRFPEALARAVVRPGATLRAARWVETQLTLRDRRLDRALQVVVDGSEEAHHVEWAWRWGRELPYRMFEYHAMLAMGLREDSERPPVIRSTLVLLSGRERPWPAWGRYRTGPRGERFTGVRFRIDAVYQRSVEELRSRDSELWLAFAPLARDADERSLAAVAAELTERAPEEGRRADLAATMVVLADADGRRRGLGDVAAALFPKELIMQNRIYAMGLADGREQGLERGIAPLVRQFARRLGRPLTENERHLLTRRLDAVGAERVGDVVLDLSPEALAAWLSDPDAR